MKILNWNVDGIRSVIKRPTILKNDILELQTFLNKYDIVALQEIKIMEKNIIDIKKYINFKWMYFSVTSNSRAGVSVFSKIKANEIYTDHDIFGEGNEYSGRYIELHFDKFVYICVYQPNSGLDKLKTLDFRTNDWDNKFAARIAELEKSNNEIIISGDMNVVKDETGTYNFKKQFNKLAGVTEREMYNFNMLLKTCKLMINTPNKYTYFSHRFKSRENDKGMSIDYVLSTKALSKKIKYVNILYDIYGSDHIPIEFSLSW